MKHLYKSSLREGLTQPHQVLVCLLCADYTHTGQAAGKEFLEDEKNVIDLPNSPPWFTYEYPQVNPPEDIVARER